MQILLCENIHSEAQIILETFSELSCYTKSKKNSMTVSLMDNLKKRYNVHDKMNKNVSVINESIVTS